jgi:hypothetical protein
MVHFFSNFVCVNHFLAELEYHHAFTQTGPTLESIDKLKLKVSAEVQTVDISQSAVVSVTLPD